MTHEYKEMTHHYRVKNSLTGCFHPEIFETKARAIDVAIRRAKITKDPYQVFYVVSTFVTEVLPPPPPSFRDLLGSPTKLQKKCYYGKAGQDIKKGDYVEYDTYTHKVFRSFVVGAKCCPECGRKE